MKIGILTGGGDCPGLNCVIRGVVRSSLRNNDEVIGIKYGWKGMIEKSFMPLDMNSVSGILPKGGTISGTSRTNPYKDANGVAKVKETFAELKLDALVAIAGEDTLGVATKLYKQEKLNIVGAPKTIDRDLSDTEVTFGVEI